MRPAGRTLFCVLLLASTARAAGSVDDLLHLAPPSAGAVLVVQDVRGHSATLTRSPFARQLAALPAAKAWLDSDAFRQFAKARTEIESALKSNFPSIRDDLLGEAVVLVLQPGPENDPAQARGLLLTKVRDRGLLDRLIAFLNGGETKNGSLLEVARRDREGVAYQHRKFRPGTKSDEWYLTFEDGTFAWSNSETLIQGAIDRKKGLGAGLLEEPLFQQSRGVIPAGCLASLFIDPRFAERIVMQGAAASGPPSNPLAAEMVSRYIRSLKYVAAGLEWRDGIFVHLAQIHDPDRVPKTLKQWATAPRGTESAPPWLPADAVAIATTSIDFPALVDALIALSPATERGRIENLMTVASGVLLGKDVRREVLPRLGPAIWLIARPPAASDARPPVTLSVRIGGPNVPGVSGLAPALDNGLKTLLSMVALDAKRGDGQEHLETTEIQGVSVTSLSGAKSPFAYAIVDGRWLVLGTTRDAVASLIAARDRGETTEFARVRAADFPGADTFAFVDVKAVTSWAEAHRSAITTKLAEGRSGSLALAEHDLDQAIALARLFRSAFVANHVEPDYSIARQVFGVRVRDPDVRP
jgi:hypothetical protein